MSINKILIVDHEKCTGCNYCMLACSMDHEGLVQRSKSRLKVYKSENEAIGIPIMCEHCENPPCIPVCPVRAIRKDPNTSVVSIDAEICTGCRECIEVCPYHAIQIYPEKGFAFICDLCQGDPKCANVCIPKAIVWVEALPSAIWRKKNRSDKRIKELERILEVY